MPDADAAKELADYIAAHLPLATAMGVVVREAGDAQVVLDVPLAPNLNHEQTAFGGSIAASGMLAGWGLIWLRARRLAPMPRLVIAQSETRYIRPLEADFEARCEWPRQDAWEQAAASIERHGRAKIPLRTELQLNRRTAAVHDGTFVVIATTP